MSDAERTVADQRAAAAPANSAFVAANAGAGKTRVLTDRVARLLLAGAAPDRILCITYTKAAAAEMAGRLYEQLGSWALAADDELSEMLRRLDGVGDGDLAAARRLFARALDTPGGLKIQTIHAFCESVLKRFPLEAGAPPGFAVLTDGDAAALIDEAFDKAMLRPEDAAARRRLASFKSPGDLRALVTEAVRSRRAAGFPSQDELFRALGADAPISEAAATAAAAAVLSRAEAERLRALFSGGMRNAQKAASGPLAAFLDARDDEARVAALAAFLLTQKGAPRDSYGDAQTNKQDPSANDFLKERAAALLSALDAVRIARAVGDTAALASLCAGVRSDYDAAKTARAALDFDDLVALTESLLSRAEARDWVAYRLDQGLDHILLDEAQDTSPLQWRVLEHLLAELTAGAGARTRRRTFFAVGDQKQSIYAFQGADAGLFDEKRVELGRRLAATGPFVEPQLKLSFRSTAPVLAFVDALFEDDAARSGLGGQDETLRHGVFRADDGGRVEVWPLVERIEDEEQRAWDAPLDSVTAGDPVRRLAETIADEIDSWSRAGRRPDGASFLPSHALILVQSRSALFHQMIRSLSRRGLPVAGPDRIKLLEDPAVEDMLAYARAVLLLTDDLSVAETLKSPFFGFTDEMLFDAAYGRAGSLFDALVASASKDAQAAAAEIAAARAVGLSAGPFAFFSRLLEAGEPSGRRRLYGRLGEPARDGVAELLRQALDYEAAHPPSLRGFLDWFSAAAGEVKRDPDSGSGGGAVRVMTVHGAKGLQAPVVFLLDAHKLPNLKAASPVVALERDRRARSVETLALTRGRDFDCAALARARAARQKFEFEEYRRKLYVAATRAEDMLVVCGLAPGRGDPAEKDDARASWHELSVRAMRRLGAAVSPSPLGERLVHERAGTSKARKSDTAAPARVSPPDFLRRPAPAQRTALKVQPSRLWADGEEEAALSPVADGAALLRGVVIHRLLETLPAIDPDRRESAAARLCARLAPAEKAGVRAEWTREALAVIERPDFAVAFGPRSRAEARVVGEIEAPGGRLIVNGSIDRLAVDGDRVLIIDYKTNRPPPADIETAPRAYLVQLAAYRALMQQIYPGKEISCALLWTFAPALMVAPAPLLDHALKSALAARLDP